MTAPVHNALSAKIQRAGFFRPRRRSAGGGNYRGGRFVGGLLKLMTPVMLVSAAIPAAAVGPFGDWITSSVALLVGAFSAAAIQILAVAIFASRLARRFRRTQIDVTERDRDAIVHFPRNVVMATAATAVVIGLPMIEIWSRIFGQEPFAALVNFAPIYLVSQAMFLLAVHRGTVARVRRMAGGLVGDGLSIQLGKQRSAGTALFLGLVVSAAGIAICLGLVARVVVRSESMHGLITSYSDLIEGVVEAAPIPRGSGASAVFDNLTRFDEAAPFVMGEDGRWRGGGDEKEAAAIEMAILSSPRGIMVKDRLGAAVVWNTLKGGKDVVGVRLVGNVDQTMFWHIIVALALAAAFGSALISMKLGSWIRLRLEERVAAVDAFGDMDLNLRGPSPISQISQIDSRLVEARRRYLEVCHIQEERISTGHKTKDEKGQVFATMSHDLRSPLNSIIGFTDLLLKGMDGSLKPPQLTTIHKISQESERLLVLIGDILDTAKMDAGRFDLDRAWVPSVEILIECEVSAQRLVASKEVGFVAKFEPGLPPVLVDKDRIGRALLSLIARVVDAMEVGTVVFKASRVRKSKKTDEGLRVEIIDAQKAVDPAQLERIEAVFNVLEGSDVDGESGEMGLGLSLARRVVRLHGGDVVARKGPDGELVISVTVPLDGADDEG